MQRFVPIITVLGLLFLGREAFAQTNNSYPMLMSLKPAAAVVGQSTEHELSARYNLAGAMSVHISGGGVRGEILPLESEKPEDKDRNDVTTSKAKLRITCDPDAVPGIRDFRVMTPHGVSTVGQLVIAREPVVAEVPDNDTVDKAQNIQLPATLCGVIEKPEDIDLYRIRVESPGQWTFHMTSQRLQNRLHDMQIRVDPMITLRSATGATLASSDNALAGDPLLVFEVKEVGEYLLEVRDVRYQGNPDWTYSLECSQRPFPLVARPSVVAAEQEAAVSIVCAGRSDPLASHWHAKGCRSTTSICRWAPEVEGVPLHGLPIVVTTEPIVQESVVVSESTTTPVPIPIPSVLSGVIEEPSQTDRFAFEAKAQERFSFEVMARRLGSQLDARLRILNAAGAAISEADDTTFERVLSADSHLENWTAPADGTYFIEVQDLHARGGMDYSYAVHVTRAEPYFLLEADTDKTLLAPGSASVLYVKAHRRNGFTGDIALQVDGLPQGVSAQTGIILASGVDGAIWLSAAADAPMGMSNVSVRGTAMAKRASGESYEIMATASNLQEVYMPGGGRGHYPVDAHTISVAKPMDIRKITLSRNVVALKPGASERVEIEVERAPDYKGNVTLDVMLQHLEQPYGNPLPKGVTVDLTASKTLLTAGENKGHITLKAAPDAPAVPDHLVPITVHVSINFVMKHTFSGEPFRIRVEGQ